MSARRGGTDYLGWIVIGVIALIFVVGLLVFPAAQRYMAHEDCIGHGATNCA